MRAEGDCPECGSTLGVQVGSSVASLMGDTIERMMDKDGNAMRCPACDEYVEPKSVDVVDQY
jgi:hypothetical protein